MGRPRRRGDCAGVPRPCPWVGCRYNLYLDVTDKGQITVPAGLRCPAEMRPDESCALDLAERGCLTLDEIGILFGVTRERIRQIEATALEWVRYWLEAGAC